MLVLSRYIWAHCVNRTFKPSKLNSLLSPHMLLLLLLVAGAGAGAAALEEFDAGALEKSPKSSLASK